MQAICGTGVINLGSTKFVNCVGLPPLRVLVHPWRKSPDTNPNRGRTNAPGMESPLQGDVCFSPGKDFHVHSIRYEKHPQNKE